MKRCLACKRVESDDTLAFCRADGTPLVSDPGSASADAGTVRFGSSPVVGEVATSVLPQQATDAGMSRATGSTAGLDAHRAAAETLVKQRYVRKEDVGEIERQASQLWDYVMQAPAATSKSQSAND